MCQLQLKESKKKNKNGYLVSVLQATGKWKEDLGECGNVAIRNVFFFLFTYQSQTTSSL